MMNPNFSLLYAPVARAEIHRLAGVGVVARNRKP
jgi:hypothetical protein